MGGKSTPGAGHPVAGPDPAPPRRRRSVYLSLLLAPWILVGAWLSADWWFCLPDDLQATYVGRGSCAECHALEVQQWTGSDHDRAMERATDESVLGDFDNAEFTQHGITSRMYRDGKKFMIRTEGPDGNLADFEIKYTFGVRPLQQYMVEFDRPAGMPDREIARLQVLRISWDTVSKRWINVPPPDVPEKLSPDDPLHWTGIAQCWNNMCAYCHSTNLQKNYDVESGIYHTTFSEIDVSCEACHGPASLHVELAQSNSWFWDRKRGYALVRLQSLDTQRQIDSCAPCHSRRALLAPNFRPGDHYHDYFNNELLGEATYYADGQIMDEDYEYGSFLQSKMFHKGIRCTDCHNPHSMQLKQDGNKVCTACHQHPATKYDSPAHHFHKSDSTGASCAECHMPETTYMEVDPRRDHSIRIPRPDVSVATGIPNACTRCHLSDAKISDEKRATLPQYRDWIDAARRGDAEVASELARIDAWMLESMQKWYKKETWDNSFAYALEAGRQRTGDAELALANLAGDRKVPAIVRATAIEQRGLLPSVGSLQPEVQALGDADPQVRRAAVSRFYDHIPAVTGRTLSHQEVQQLSEQVAPILRQLVPLLDDPRRSVRVETGRVLARLPGQLAAALLNGNQREQLDRAIEQYIVGVLESNDRGGAHMELGVLYEAMGREADALAAYRTSIRVEPRMTGPRSNLAALLEQRGEREMRRAAEDRPGEEARPWQAEAVQLRQEELELLARDARLLPSNAALQYRYGLSLYLNGQQQAAEQALRAAATLEPDNDQFLFALVLFFDKYERYEEAQQALDHLLRLRPGHREYLQVRDEIAEKLRLRVPAK
ncbi:MAG: cytochrome c3 family protein [Pirellulaceae bacterium]